MKRLLVEFWRSGFLLGFALAVLILWFAPGEWPYKVGGIAVATTISIVATTVRVRRSRVLVGASGDVFAEYRRTLEAWASKVGTRSADRLLARQEVLVRQLMRSSEGRRNVELLLDHDADGVRALAAHAVWYWNQELARITLAEIGSATEADPAIAQLALDDLANLQREADEQDPT